MTNPTLQRSKCTEDAPDTGQDNTTIVFNSFKESIQENESLGWMHGRNHKFTLTCIFRWGGDDFLGTFNFIEMCSLSSIYLASHAQLKDSSVDSA